MRLNAVNVWVLPFVLQLSKIIDAEPLNRLCPPPESIAPCKCQHFTTGAKVLCYQVGSSLTKAVPGLKGYAIAQLSIVGAEFDDASKDLYEGLHIEDLSVSKIEIKEALDPEGYYFRGLENSLTTLEVSKSFKSKPLSILRVSNLRHLKHLLFTDNEIPDVTKGWFSGGAMVIESLIFERNNIKSVGDEAFSSLKDLRTFALAGNSLTGVSRSMLPQPASHLKTLDLAYNKIKSIPANFFENMPALQNVNLNYNALTTVSQTVMSQIWNQLLELSFEGNALKCDEEIKWICNSRKISLTGECHSPPEAAGKSLMEVC